MAKAKDPEKKRPDSYRDWTLRPLHGLAFILPMLVAFQVGASLYGSSLLAPRDLHKLLRYFGAHAVHLPAVFIIVVLLAQHILHGDPWKLQPKVLAGMFGESLLWTIPLVVMAELAGRLMTPQALAAGQNESDFVQQLVLAFGAGVHEEFIFRLVFISLVMLVFVDIIAMKREPVAVVAVLLAAAAFSLYHFSLAEVSSLATFPWGLFLLRWIAGVYLGGLFVFRGYGIAVGAHVAYNIYVAIVSSPLPMGN